MARNCVSLIGSQDARSHRISDQPWRSGSICDPSPERTLVHAQQRTEGGEQTAVQKHVAMTWMQRLKRVFRVDVETCARCGGRLQIIAGIEDPRRHPPHPRARRSQRTGLAHRARSPCAAAPQSVLTIHRTGMPQPEVPRSARALLRPALATLSMSGLAERCRAGNARWARPAAPDPPAADFKAPI